MRLGDLEYKPLYILPKDDFVNEVLISSLKLSQSLDCMFGFFGSAALSSIAPGLAEFLVRTDAPMRLVVSPNIQVGDLEALESGSSTAPELMEQRLVEIVGEAKVSANALVRHTLVCLSYLLANGRLEIRVAWLKDGALFHPKVWFFDSDGESVVAHGSSNMTLSGLGRNHEQIRVDASWYGTREVETIRTLREEFEALWEGGGDYAYTIGLPSAVEQDLIRTFKPERPPSDEDFRRAWVQDQQKLESFVLGAGVSGALQSAKLVKPPELDLYSGDFSHQGKALDAWRESGWRGILAMATGSGKTITALAGAELLQDEVDQLLVIVSAPYRPLISQWIAEIKLFGVDVLPLKGNAAEKAQAIDLAVRGLVSGISRLEIAVITENFLTDDRFHEVLDRIPASVSTLLIADEVHNLGKRSFTERPPDRFDYRLGLSATPERQYDEDGTRLLFDFFGPKVFEFSLQDAIGVCLVPYNYHIHQVSLSDEEYDEWLKITEKLRRKGFGGDSDPSESGKLSDDVQKLLIARRRVLEAAEEKIHALHCILKERNRDDLKHVLVYATDKSPAQLDAVNEMLQESLHLTIHQLTSSETQSKNRSAKILQKFSDGDYHVLTAKRVLDEGVDVPQVSEAFLLASNTVRRQWVQRRGRVLRKCDSIGKTIANLHDFLVIPPDPSDKSARSILRSELDRAREFSELAENAGARGGPFEVMERLMNAMYR